MKIYRPLFLASTLALSLSTSLFSCTGSTDVSNSTPDPTPSPTPQGVTVSAPTVSSTNPADGDKGVFINRQISANFSQALNAASLTTTTFTLMQGTTPVQGTVTAVGSIASFKPSSNLAAGTLYTATLTSGVTDSKNQALAATKTWTFTTSATADTTAPTVLSTDPEEGRAGFVINRNITATFSEPLDPESISATSFTLMQGTTPIAGTVTTVGSVATFKPATNLAADTQYSAKVSTAVKDLAGNALGVNQNWNFTTGSVLAAGPAPVALGAAGQFVILSKAGITNVASSAITGDIGTSPITGASIVGLDCIQVVGKIYAVDPTGPACSTTDSVYLTTAVSDMEIAYTDAAGRTSPNTTELNAGELGGLTLAPGLHKWGTNVLVSTEVKLSGGANDVWIFQIAGDLTQANGIHVTLEGGAQAKNIFWQVAGQVKLGTTSRFAGTILSHTLIALKTGAVLNGRALAQTAVTLESNDVRKP